MSKQELEQRVLELEKRVAELEASLVRPEPGSNDWLKTFGMFRGDEAAKRMDEKILAARERERRKARRRAAKTRKKPSARAKA
jgi:hypothetical protein